MVTSVTIAQAACTKFKPTRPGEVYLLRGLANVFSLGMDEMSKKYTSLGIENCVNNHSVWSGLANDILERSYKNRINYPIVIVGHSLGAGAAPEMATRLGKYGIRVSYVVMFDPVKPTLVGKNVDEIINYYIYKPGKDKILKPTADFDGKFENIDLAGRSGIDHLNIDKNKSLQNSVYQKTLELSDAVVEANTETKK